VLAVLDRYEVRLLRYATRLLGEEHAARDAVQHAFLQLCEQSPVELEGREAPWLFAVCRNKALDVLRAQRRLNPADEAEVAGCRSREPDPAARAEREDLYGRLAELVARLPAGQREAIDLWAEGFSYRQIGRIVGQTEGGVRVLVHRALKHLREQCEVHV
jgi:RNA polymerase sigma-70 factor (ECF subfamily)